MYFMILLSDNLMIIIKATLEAKISQTVAFCLRSRIKGDNNVIKTFKSHSLTSSAPP